MTGYAGGQAGGVPRAPPPGMGLPRSSGSVCNQAGSSSRPSDEAAGPQEVALSPLPGSSGHRFPGRRGAGPLLSPSPCPSPPLHRAP